MCNCRKQYGPVSMSEEQIIKTKDFDEKHIKCSKGSGFLEIIIRFDCSIGPGTILRCFCCGEEEDITDVGMW
jgi:hypothetical protein